MFKSKFRNTQLTAPSSVSNHNRTRRNFLRQSARAGFGLGLLCATNAVIFGQDQVKIPITKNGYFAVPEGASNALKRSSFARHNGDHFEAVNDFGQGVILNLLKVEDLRSQRDLFAKRQFGDIEEAQLKEESFSLIFRGPLAMPLRQRTYRLKHYALGQLEIFLVPVGQDAGARYYEAVFNRSTRA
jgi:hypothetical protein